MRSTIRRLLLAGAALALPSAPAQAITCYLVYDRNDNAVFQDTYPPIDLSDRGAAERAAMYKRGEHLIVMESDRCPQIQFFTGSGGSTTLSVDEVVGGMRAGAQPTGGTTGVAAGKAATPAATGAKPASKPSAPKS